MRHKNVDIGQIMKNQGLQNQFINTYTFNIYDQIPKSGDSSTDEQETATNGDQGENLDTLEPLGGSFNQLKLEGTKFIYQGVEEQRSRG